MRDQFADIKPGEKLAGLPTRPWNKFLELVRPDLTGDAAEGKASTSVEVRVANQTAGPIDAYGVLGLAGLNPFTPDPDTWKDWDVFAGVAPSAGAVIAIVRDGIGPGEVGWARLVGRACCRVDITNVNHRYAGPTTSTGQLTSSASGPARIVAVEDNFAAPGVRWAVVILGGFPPTGFIRFALSAPLATTEASKGAAVESYWGAGDPGTSVTVWNLPAAGGGYVFAGATGAKGYATLDAVGGKWAILQMECGTAGGGGGGTGFTGTLGN